jgi:hypothetical protein
MAPASLVPSLDADIHLVLCRFGRAGLAYIETDPAEADATTVVQNLLHGRYGQPLRIKAGQKTFQRRWHTRFARLQSTKTTN